MSKYKKTHTREQRFSSPPEVQGLRDRPANGQSNHLEGHKKEISGIWPLLIFCGLIAGLLVLAWLR